MLDTPSGCCCIAGASLARAGPPNLKGPKYTCKRGGLRLPAPRPHQNRRDCFADFAATRTPPRHRDLAAFSSFTLRVEPAGSLAEEDGCLKQPSQSFAARWE